MRLASLRSAQVQLDLNVQGGGRRGGQPARKAWGDSQKRFGCQGGDRRGAKGPREGRTGDELGVQECARARYEDYGGDWDNEG